MCVGGQGRGWSGPGAVRWAGAFSEGQGRGLAVSGMDSELRLVEEAGWSRVADSEGLLGT